jgi:hypothetical protein
MVTKPKKAREAAKASSKKKAKTAAGQSGGNTARKLEAPKRAPSKSRSASPKKPAKVVGKKTSAKPEARPSKPEPPKKKIAAGKKLTAAGSRKKTSIRSSSVRNGDEQVIDDFKSLVNLTRNRLESWLATDESKKVDLTDLRKGEPAAYESGKRIVELIGKRRDKYSDDDVKHIHKVVDHIKRNLAQRPKGDVTASNWRYSLMNWGHDPAR